MQATDYVAWAEENLKVSISFVDIFDICPGERGVSCREKVPENSTVMQMPFSSIMTVKSTESNCVCNLVDKLREEDLLAVLLLYEKFAEGPSSRWVEHIRILPQAYHSISNFEDEELDWIRGSNLYVTAVAWKEQIRNDYTELIQTIIAESSCRHFVSEGWLTFDNYHWALSTIWSRFISISRNDKLTKQQTYYKGMVPAADIFNHSPTSKASHIYSEEEGLFKMITLQGWNQGDEICISYGNSSNSKLLMLYGFTLIDNPYASVDIWVSMDENSLNFKVKSQALAALSLSCTECFPIFENVFPTKLIAFLRIQHATTPIELNNMSNAMTQSLSISSDRMVVNALIDALQSMLSGYTDSITENEAKLVNWGILQRECEDGTESAKPATGKFIAPEEREKHATILVYTEKKVLLSVIKLLENYIETL